MAASVPRHRYRKERRRAEEEQERRRHERELVELQQAEAAEAMRVRERRERVFRDRQELEQQIEGVRRCRADEIAQNLEHGKKLQLIAAEEVRRSSTGFYHLCLTLAGPLAMHEQRKKEELRDEERRRRSREVQAECLRVNSEQRELKLQRMERERELDRDIAAYAERKDRVWSSPQKPQMHVDAWWA
eukprot:scaffold167_cov347-Prasinococcus_capsulatus_cf.AAC.19